MNLDLFHVGPRRYARFPRLGREPGLVHAYSTRPDDVSARTDDRAPQRSQRRFQMAADLGLAPESLTHTVQVHRTECDQIHPNSPHGPREGIDALITNVANRPLMTFSADCPLVLAYDPRRGALGMVHSSWRCTTAGATRNLIERMSSAFGTNPLDVLAGIGPSAGPCCYEVKDDVYEAARGLPDFESLFPRRDSMMFFDLWEANRRELIAAGVSAGNIELASACTMCTRDLFFSFRREGPGCGHFGLMAALR